MTRNIFLMALCATLLTACGGTNQDTASGATTIPISAETEARRMAAIYKFAQDLSNVLAPLSESQLNSRAGKTFSCTSSGTVVYAFTAPVKSGDPTRATVAFHSCSEPSGVYDGSVSLSWFDTDGKPDSAVLQAGFDASLTVGASAYGITQGVAVNELTPSSGHVVSTINVGSHAFYSGDEGPTYIADASWKVEFGDVAPRYNALRVEVRTTSTNDSMRADSPGLLPAVMDLPGAAVLGIRHPGAGSMSYSRASPPEKALLTATIDSKADESMSIVVDDKNTDSESKPTGSFPWASLLADPEYEPEGM